LSNYESKRRNGRLVEFGGRNMAFNVGFVPDDKLTWKPSPDAASVLEIVSHAAFALSGGIAMLQSGQWIPEKIELKTRDEAQKLIGHHAETFAKLLRALKPADLEGTVETPLGADNKTDFLRMIVIDVLHHHGQITYLQTVWGDTDDHFYEAT
jgi:hypothetical protein